MSPLKIRNREARALWLASQHLSATPTGPLDLPDLVDKLGMVQLDTIQTVARAHHHILWSRNQNYREKHLDRLYRERQVFEHFTHDASILPMSILPYWRRQFERMRRRLEGSSWWSKIPDATERAVMKARFAAEGSLCTRHFESDAPRSKEMWARPPHKAALDYMWHTGELATCHRDGFVKYYNLAENIFPADLWAQDVPEVDQVNWLCHAALDRMGFGTLGEIRKFWEAAEVKEVKAWGERTDLVPLQIENAKGDWYDAVGPADIEARLARLVAPSSRLRILNPFDPVIRDRARLERLFGFDYRNEMFVPAAKRIWGYYVFPLLEGDRLVGRIEAKAFRAEDRLEILKIWPEAGIRWGQARWSKLEAEAQRLARFVGVSALRWPEGTPLA